MIVQARMVKSRGKKSEFQCLSQLYTDIVESTAIVVYILTVVQRRWGEDYTLVTNGLELLDSPGTRGTNLQVCYQIGLWSCDQ